MRSVGHSAGVQDTSSRSLAELAMCLGLAAVTVALWAGPAGAADQTPSERSNIASVIMKLKKEKDDFKTFVDQSISPAMEKIRVSFQANLAKASELFEKLKRDPTNPQLATEYEDVLSTALVQIDQFLVEFQALKEPSFEALERVTEAVKEAREALVREAAAHLAGNTARDCEKSAEALDGQLRALTDLRADLVVAFRTADNHSALTKMIADKRAQRVRAMQLARIVAEFKQASVQKIVDVTELSRIVGDIARQTGEATPGLGHATSRDQRAQEGAAILKKCITNERGSEK